MGTNYYATWDACDCCGRSERAHVGKSYRLLRAYGEADPTGAIGSWADWERWLIEHDAVIVDEYGDIVDRDEFVARWQPLPDAGAITEAANARWRSQFQTDLGEYVDDDGYRLTRREFS